MKITDFSSNQPERTFRLQENLRAISEEVYFVSEVNTVFPGEVQDFYKKSITVQSYFKNVMASEKRIFGDLGFNKSNIRQFSIKLGDLNKLKYCHLKEALKSDYYVVFGASFIEMAN